jgi:hypothetical protein
MHTLVRHAVLAIPFPILISCAKFFRDMTDYRDDGLNAAIMQLNRNNHIPACNQLNAFLNQVGQKLTSGQLTPQQAGDLRQQAIAIQRAIGCSRAGLGGLVGSSSGEEDDTEDLPLPMS